MLTTKKRAQIFLIFALGFAVIGGSTGCAPSGARALRQGDALIKKGKYAEAVKKFEEATKALPTNARAWNHLGLGYQYAGDAKKSAQAYQQALALDQNLAIARFNLGSLYLEQRNYPAAMMELTTFVQLEPKNPDGWLKMGAAQMRLASSASTSEKNRQLDAAIKSLEYSQKLRPSVETLNTLGLAQIQRGQVRDAISSFKTALQQQPSYAPAWLNLAVIHHQSLNDRRQALANYRKFLSVAKGASEVAQVQAVIRQLESELTPTVAAPVSAPTPNPTPAPTVSAKPQVAADVPTILPKPETNIAKPEKIETNIAKTTPAPTPAPTAKPSLPISSPKAQARVEKETPPEKETRLEVATLPDEPPVKAAQDVPTPGVSKPVNPPPVVATVPPKSAPIVETPEKNPGVLTKINPVTWFKKKPKTTTPVTELPTSKPSIEEDSTTGISKEKSLPIATAQSKRTIPRYQYRSPAKPSAGDRAEASRFFTRGVQAHKDRRLADALDAYRQAIKADPAYYEARYNLGLATRDAGDLAASLSTYEQALAIMPESVNARYNFAYTLQEAGYFQDAANELQKLLRQNPNETRAHLLLGNLFAQRLDQIPQARESYQKVLEAEPQHPQALQIRYWMAAHP